MIPMWVVLLGMYLLGWAPWALYLLVREKQGGDYNFDLIPLGLFFLGVAWCVAFTLGRVWLNQ